MTPNIKFDGEWRQVPGHGFGLEGPLVIGTLLWPDSAQWNLTAIREALADEFPEGHARIAELLCGEFNPQTFLEIVHEIEVGRQIPILRVGKVIGSTPAKDHHRKFAFALPVISLRFTRSAIQWLIARVNRAHADNRPAAPSQDGTDSRQALDQARLTVPDGYLGSVNNVRIARAASELHLSFRWLLDGHLLVGSGRNGRLFRSTLTESTASIGVNLARSKSQTATLLNLSGLPTVKHQRARTIEQAIQCAKDLGYPVVIKPNGLDGGAGVYAGLQDEEQLRRYYERASAVSRDLLVEKHVDGQDYRITVDNGRVVKAILRRPGGVTGDGRQTVSQLVAAQQAAAPAARSRRTLISLDEEARAMLSRCAMTPDSIPADGQFVAMRMRANMSTGGTSQDAIGCMHPDNARLAVRATDVLRLDLAGVDLLIPDIAVSWLTSGAAICEINAQPQISTEFAPEVFRDIIRRSVPAPGDLKTVVVIDFGGGDALAEPAVSAIAAAMKTCGERVFSSGPEGLLIDGDRVGPPVARTYAAAMAAVLDRRATAAVIAMPVMGLRRDGLPWSRVDRICITGLSLGKKADETLIRACADWFGPHLHGSVVVEQSLASRVRSLVSGDLDIKTFTRTASSLTTEWLDDLPTPTHAT